MQLQFGATTETGTPMGLISEDHLSFEIFARCTKSAKIIASQSRPNVLLVDRSVFASFPSGLNLPVNPVTFKYGEIAYGCYDCPLPADERPEPPAQGDPPADAAPLPEMGEA
jgi:hypothetical protein